MLQNSVKFNLGLFEIIVLSCQKLSLLQFFEEANYVFNIKMLTKFVYSRCQPLHEIRVRRSAKWVLQ